MSQVKLPLFFTVLSFNTFNSAYFFMVEKLILSPLTIFFFYIEMGHEKRNMKHVNCFGKKKKKAAIITRAAQQNWLNVG